MTKTIAVFIDGTWSDPTDEHRTNVFKLHAGCVNDDKQVTHYLAGVGNEAENGWFGKFMGGSFGRGADKKVRAAVSWVHRVYHPGDCIMVFGFSRGAAIARMVAAGVTKGFSRGYLLKVDFLGCFDTVGAFGVPIGPFQKINLFKDMHVGPQVKNALHLVALDETRPAFVPTLMNEREGIKEIWLPGVHGDVGGGEPHTGLSDLSLGVMAREAQKHGLRLRSGFLKALQPDPTAKAHDNRDSALGAEPRLACVQRDDKPTNTPAILHDSALNRKWPNSPLAWPPAQ